MAALDLGQVAALEAWISRAGLAGKAEDRLLVGFCRQAREAGLPLTRAVVVADTLHPVHEGRAFRWRCEEADQTRIIEYGRTGQGGEAAEAWRRSTFFNMLETGSSVMSRCLAEAGPEFTLFDELRADGQTGYLAFVHRFADDNVIGEMDCIYSSWTTDRPGGFTAEEGAAMERLCLPLALAIKTASLARIAETLVETYLGRDAGRRVLSGRIERGVADRIEAVLWFSDLRGYTRITGGCSPEEIIPFLNDYSEAVISAVHEAGGDVLKLIGDGTLAIFNETDAADACRSALRAESLARERIKAVNERRAAMGLATTDAYLGLHVGEVFYGNVGSHDRLDFTVVGPAVNEAARIAAMCRSAERDVLVSAEFRDAASADDRDRLVSVGRYALRGLERAQDLFTLDSASE